MTALVEPTEDDDDEPAEKYWRAEDFVAKASMDELTGTWITDENGILDEDAAGDTWTDCLGASGELDRQEADEATEKALDSWLAHGVVEDMKREDTKGFKTLTARWDKRWRMKDGEWKMKVRFFGREYIWAERREDLFSPGATHAASRVIDFLALKMGLEKFEADAVDAYYQAPEHEQVVVELRRNTGHRHRVAFEKAVCQGDVQAGQKLGGTRRWNSCEQSKFCAVHDSTTVLLEFRENALELHMDDIHGAATPSGREKFVKDQALEINFKGGDRCETRKPYEHLKRLRLPMTGETRIQPNPKHLDFVANQLGLTSAKTRPTSGVLSHRATMGATPLLTDDDARLKRSCVGALMYDVLDRADTQLEVSILETYLRTPISGTMEALRRVTRHLLGT